MRLFSLWVWLLSLLLMGCQPSPGPSRANSEPVAPLKESRAVSVHDLSRDEEQGGHTLKKHVGRSDSELRDRLRRERRIAAASTYTDRETAERSIGAAIQQNQARIDTWLARSGSRPNLVLDYDAYRPIGRTLRRGDENSQPCSHALVVLKWVGPAGYYVLTSYPECRA